MKKMIGILLLAGSSLFAGPRVFVGLGVGVPVPYAAPYVAPYPGPYVAPYVAPYPYVVGPRYYGYPYRPAFVGPRFYGPAFRGPVYRSGYRGFRRY